MNSALIPPVTEIAWKKHEATNGSDLIWCAVFESSSDDPRDHIGLAEWATKDKYIYEVDPIGDLIEDPVPLV